MVITHWGQGQMWFVYKKMLESSPPSNYGEVQMGIGAKNKVWNF